MGAHMLAPDSQDHSGGGAIGDRDEDRGGDRRLIRATVEIVAAKQWPRLLAVKRQAEPLGERAHCGSSPKNAPWLQIPGGS